MKQISSSTTDSIVALLHQGLSTREVAKRVGISQSTVVKVAREHVPERSGVKAGRPGKLTQRQKNLIVRKVTSGQVDTAVDMQRYINSDENIYASVETIRNCLKKAGLKSFAKVKKPLLQGRHIKQRLAFALKHQHWTVEDWKRVVWSDETKVNRMGSDGRKWGWRARNARLQPYHVQATLKHGGGSIMVWGCMTVHGVGNLVRIDGGLNAELYCKILDEDLAPSFEFYGRKLADFVFQQDNDPKHTSKLAKKWIADHRLEVLNWSAQSPDLNPIEHLWVHLKRKLAEHESAPTSIHGLWERVEHDWNAIPPSVCCNLIESMPRRIAEVIKAKGGYTKY